MAAAVWFTMRPSTGGAVSAPDPIDWRSALEHARSRNVLIGVVGAVTVIGAPALSDRAGRKPVLISAYLTPVALGLVTAATAVCVRETALAVADAGPGDGNRVALL